MQDYRKLRVWELAHDLTLHVYRVTRTFPKEEMYGLTNQMRRSASSIAFNLAEGRSRRGDSEFARFIVYAIGSAAELDSQLLLARDLDMLDEERYALLEDRTAHVRQMLSRLLTKVSAGGGAKGERRTANG
jgi:four helix bundle protein